MDNIDGFKWFHAAYIEGIKSKRTKRTVGGFIYHAEAVVVEEDDKNVYVYADRIDGTKRFAVSEKSMINTVSVGNAGTKCAEDYNCMDNAKKSRYGKVFMMLDAVIERMEKGLK